MAASSGGGIGVAACGEKPENQPRLGENICEMKSSRENRKLASKILWQPAYQWRKLIMKRNNEK
jgi:hypothetical protein